MANHTISEELYRRHEREWAAMRNSIQNDSQSKQNSSLTKSENSDQRGH